MNIPLLHWLALGVTALYGLAALGGGILGYVRADSKASLIAGGIAGILLLLCASGIPYRPTWALIGAILISLALLGRFLPALLRHTKDLAEFLQTVAGGTALVMATGGVLVVLIAALALFFVESRPPTGL